MHPPSVLPPLRRHRRVPRRRGARGMVLVIVLLLLLALSILAALAAKGVTMGERQARNEMEYQIARQAADAALRDAERDLMLDTTQAPPAGAICERTGPFRGADSTLEGDFDDQCTQGQCLLPATRYAVAWDSASATNPGEPWWPVSKGGVWSDYFANKKPNGGGGAPDCATFTGSVPLGLFTGAPAQIGVARQPEYLIESLSPGTYGQQDVPYQCTTTPTSDALGVLASEDSPSGAPGGTGQKCNLFRITARGWGPTTATEVVLQSYFSKLK